MAEEVDTSKWPPEVEQITLNNMARLGVHRTNHKLYWDGAPLITERRFSTQERVIAWAGVALAAVGVSATVMQSWAAWLSIPPPH